MAGSIKWFIYTSDRGDNFAIKLDESNTEAVNGGTQDLIDGLTVINAVPRNIKPRKVYYANVARTRTIGIVALTPTIYNGVLSGTVPTITDPLDDTQTLSFVRAQGEEVSVPFAFDTAQDDGDAT
jgi:hypothetical protein